MSTTGPRRTLLPALAAVLLTPLAAAGVQETRLPDLEPFLMDRADEIAMARSAAPFQLGEAAGVWVLTPRGYERAEEGTNGFECFVGRGWSGPILVGPPGAKQLHPDVFDHDLRAPHCFNPQAARSVLPWQFARTRSLLDGVPAEAVDETVNALIGSALELPEPGAMAYMTSPHQDLGPDFGAWRPHVMIYLPELTNRDWGIPGFSHDFPFVAEAGGPWAVAVVPMRRYADGTEAAATVEGRDPAPALPLPTTNPPAVVRERIAATDIEISYHRPRVKGRRIFGGLVPFGQVWRTGADNATLVTFSTEVSVEGTPVPAGSYELFTIPGEDRWTVILQEARSQWGSYAYDPAHDVVRVTVRPETTAEPVESFTLAVEDIGTDTGTLGIRWDRTRVPVRLSVDVRTVIPSLEEALRTAERPPYFLAAMFYFENGIDLERAAELIARAVEQSPGHIGILHRQALILEAQGDVEGAARAARASLAGAQEAPRELREEYTRLNTALLERIGR